MSETISNPKKASILEQFEATGAAVIAEEHGLDFVEDGGQIILIEDSEVDPMEDEVRDALKTELKEISGVEVDFGLL